MLTDFSSPQGLLKGTLRLSVKQVGTVPQGPIRV